MSILCIGQAVYDLTIKTDKNIIENQKYRIEEDVIKCIGGPCANASYLCGLWGADVSLISRLGDDEYGKCVLEQLKKVKVNTKNILIDQNISTPYSIIIANTSNGNRTIYNFPDTKERKELSLQIEQPSVILVDGHELDASIKAIEKHKNAISILDAGTFRETTKILAGMVDYLVCSEDFANQYSNDKICEENRQDIFKKLENLCKKNIVITLGEKGLLYKIDGKIINMPAFKTKAVDTTGAGDIFHGAFAYCIDKGFDIEKTLQICSMTASISVETIGGQCSIPNLDKVFKKLKFDIK